MKLKVWVVRVSGRRQYLGIYTPAGLAIELSHLVLYDGDVIEAHVVIF